MIPPLDLTGMLEPERRAVLELLTELDDHEWDAAHRVSGVDGQRGRVCMSWATTCRCCPGNATKRRTG